MTGIFLAAMLFLFAEPSAQTAPAAPDIAMQREKMEALSIIVGEWRGEGWMMTREGRVAFTQTEVVKPALGGTVLLINGTGRGAGQPADAEPVFEALAIVSYDEKGDKYMMRSYAQGRAGDFEIRPRSDGFSWSLTNVEYDAVVRDGVWTEKGFYKGPDGKMIQFIEFTVRRVD